MADAIILLGIIQSLGISLGVGSSTLAILNFFHAIADGKIDETERNFMGVTYLVLRIAMGTIFVGLFGTIIIYFHTAELENITNYLVFQTILLAVLFMNAALMTLRYMPSTFGPAIQASAWYTLGILAALKLQGLGGDWPFYMYVLMYLTTAIFAVSLVNGVMAYLNSKPAV
jgi:hypothetical protein